MRARNRGRWLAPLALIAVVAATFLVVRSGLRDKTSASAQTTIPLSITRHRVGRHRFYAVRAGDSLSSISGKTGISVSTLQALNPTVNPNALQTGQRLRLSR